MLACIGADWRGGGAGPRASCSGVNLGAVAEVEADRLHDPERGARGEHVRRRQHAGVLGDDGRGGAVGQLVKVGFHRGPDVLPVLWKYGVGSTVASACLALASMSATYCWCTTMSSRVPGRPRWPPMKCFHG